MFPPQSAVWTSYKNTIIITFPGEVKYGWQKSYHIDIHHFADDIFLCISLGELFCTLYAMFCFSLFLSSQLTISQHRYHDDVIKWKHFPRYWLFVRGIHRSPVSSPHKDRWRGALMLPLICSWINGWVNNREARDLRRHNVHYDVTVITDNCLPPNHRQVITWITENLL